MFPAWQADGLVEDYAHYARGEAALITPTIEEITGRQPHSFAPFVQDYAPAFGLTMPRFESGEVNNLVS